MPQIGKIALLLLFTVLFSVADLYAQEVPESFGDTITTKQDKVNELESAPVAKNPAPGMSRPAKAALFSAVVPGLGQIYNKKFWKLPILYGGAAVIGYLLIDNHNNYKTFDEAYSIRTDGDPATVDEFQFVYTQDNTLRVYRDYYRRNRDLSIIAGVLLYGLQIVDAHVDAHMRDYDISDDLSLRVSPDLLKLPYGQQAPALSLTLNLKR